MAAGELTILRALRIADVLREQFGDGDEEPQVTCDTTKNLIVVTTEGGTVIVLRPISISPVQ